MAESPETTESDSTATKEVPWGPILFLATLMGWLAFFVWLL